MTPPVFLKSQAGSTLSTAVTPGAYFVQPHASAMYSFDAWGGLPGQ